MTTPGKVTCVDSETSEAIELDQTRSAVYLSALSLHSKNISTVIYVLSSRYVQDSWHPLLLLNVLFRDVVN